MIDKNEKGKAVAKIGPQSSTGIGTSKAGSSSQAQCFSCGERGHTSYACPQRRVNFAEFDGDDSELFEPIYDDYIDQEENVDLLPVEGESLVLRRVMTAPKQEKEDWRWRSIFRTRVLCEGKVCNLILDGDSTENIISKEAVEKLKLPMEKHPNPYKISWFQKGNEVPVTSRCLVKFNMGNTVDDEAWCDVIPMDACHILLGRPWLFDKNMVHLTRANTYSFHKDGKKLTLQPLKEELFNTSKVVKTNNLLTAHKFELESQDMGVVF